ncbi:hypothetical protein [Rhodoferax ferrireducens]|uniref:hypothetical protein n=1 Tax=Rhodoferax ferrireducens TaxID=192843 RepID=UPI00140FC872|nr:hypothetical protein [Rhodoferax ferrireducens]
MTPQKTSKKGRPTKHWSDILRVKLWYLSVSDLSGVSDYELDMRFGFSLGETPSSADRPRLFEEIRKKNRIPSRGNHWRKPSDIVARVANHPGLESTIRLYEADFWRVIKELPTTLSQANKMVQVFLTKHQLERITWHDAKQAITTMSGERPDEHSCFSHCLKTSFQKLVVLDRLTGLVLLNRQADMSGNLEMTEILRSHLDESLELFFSPRFGWQEAMDYYQLALEDICFGARGGGSSEMDLRTRYESITRDPILPMTMVSDFYAKRKT